MIKQAKDLVIGDIIILTDGEVTVSNIATNDPWVWIEIREDPIPVLVDPETGFEVKS